MKDSKRNASNYFKLPFNPKLRERAKELRKAGNLPEVLFWNRVKQNQFLNLDFDRQKIIGNYIVDFYCPNAHVVIEIDGDSHIGKEEYDKNRDLFLESLNLVVIHIDVDSILNHLDNTMLFLESHEAFERFKD